MSNKTDTPMADAGFFEDEVGDEVFPGQQTPNNASLGDSASAPAANGAGSVHAASGYRWSREEDAPGYRWKNKKATEEAARAWDSLVGKEQRGQRS